MENIQLYNNEVKKLDETEAGNELIRFWETVYQKHENKIDEVWGIQQKEEYEISLREENLKRINERSFPLILREHMDTDRNVGNEIKPMEKPKLTEQVKACLKN